MLHVVSRMFEGAPGLSNWRTQSCANCRNFSRERLPLFCKSPHASPLGAVPPNQDEMFMARAVTARKTACGHTEQRSFARRCLMVPWGCKWSRETRACLLERCHAPRCLHWKDKTASQTQLQRASATRRCLMRRARARRVGNLVGQTHASGAELLEDNTRRGIGVCWCCQLAHDPMDARTVQHAAACRGMPRASRRAGTCTHTALPAMPITSATRHAAQEYCDLRAGL